MVSSLMIPESMLPILPELDESENNPRRITLLHKRDDVFVCVLSRGLEEIVYGKPVENTFVLSMFGPEKIAVSYHPSISFHKRGFDSETGYVNAHIRDGINERKKKKIIPYILPESFASDIGPKGQRLDSKIDHLVSLANRRFLTSCEAISERGLFTAGKDPKGKEIGAEYKETGAVLYREIEGLFP